MNPVALTDDQQEKLENLINSGRIRRVPSDLAKAERFIEQSQSALAELPMIKNNQLRYIANPIGKAQADATLRCAEVLLQQSQIILR